MNRKNKIIGQFVILVLTIGLAGWWVYEIRQEISAPSRVSVPEAVVEAIEVPPADYKDRLRSTLDVVDRLPTSGIRLAEMDRSLMLTPEEMDPESAAYAQTAEGPDYVPPTISMLFFNHQRYAVLDGKPYREGGVLADGRIVRAIDYDGVVLEWPMIQTMTEQGITERLERVVWIPPLRVELKRPTSTPRAPAQPDPSPSLPGMPELPVLN